MKETYLRGRNEVYCFRKDDDGECWVTRYKDLGTLGTYVSWCKRVEPEDGNGIYRRLTEAGLKKAVSLAR